MMPAIDPARILARALRNIEKYDTTYDQRYRWVFGALYAALLAGLDAGVKVDPAEPGWPVVYIELPTGQVSWHMPEHGRPWDGHSTEEKYARCREYASIQGE